MAVSNAVTVRVDVARIRRNARDILATVGVPIIAVVKADAYGLGAVRVAEALADLVEGFYVFDLREAVEYRLRELTGKRTIALLGDSKDPDDYLARHIQPVVWTADRAAALRKARPVLAVDTGQQRFGCPVESVGAVLRAGDCEEAFTHATRMAQVRLLVDAMKGIRGSEPGRPLRLHAAGSSLLGDTAAALDAVRPGMALYQGAARVSARLVEERESKGPAGYGGFVVPRHGVILAGYTNGLRPGPCLINGRRSRVLEVGMQSAFVETAAGDRVGDEVVLLGEGLAETEVAAQWGVTPQEALSRLARAGEREYEV